jgi:hypothetical protein
MNANTDKHPFRKVIRHYDTTNRYCRPGEGSRWHVLECGHEVVTKQSAGFPNKKRCRECWYAQRQGTGNAGGA